MKKSIVSVIIFLLSLSFVLAAGSSSGGNSANSAQDNSPNATSSTQVSKAEACENIGVIRERILCRFKLTETERKSYNQRFNVIEEACRGSEKQEQCKQLYKKLAPCYKESNASNAKKCMLKESGINLNQGGTFKSAPREVKRNYVVAQLYNLQERIEAMHERGEITDEQATDLVNSIVGIKKMIINGSPRADIVPKMQEFKQKFKEVIA